MAKAKKTKKTKTTKKTTTKKMKAPAKKKLTAKSAKRPTKKITVKAKKMTPKTTTSKPMATRAPKATPGLTLGQPVPEIALEATGSKTINLSQLKGKNVVLYFYPKDATPGCTIEGHDFTRLHNEFKAIDTEVYGVSRDSLDSHEKFKTKECYSIDLISDPEEKLCRTFNVIKLKNMYGKEVMGIERSTFFINKEGKLVKEWRGVSVPGHAEEVLQFAKTATTEAI